MDNISRIKKLSIWIFLIPIVVLNLCLFISVNYIIFEDTIFSVDQIGRSGFTIPYFDGGVSISRSARTYPTYLLFKPGMIITSILLIKYWIENNKLFLEIIRQIHKTTKIETSKIQNDRKRNPEPSSMVPRPRNFIFFSFYGNFSNT